MSKQVMIPVALAAMLTLTAVPAAAQRHPGPSDLRDADRAPQTAIAIPALIRSRAQAEPSASAPAGDRAILACRKTGGDAAAGDSCAGKVRVFDGAGGPPLRAADEPTSTANATLYGRKAGDDKRLDAQPEREEAAAARTTGSNNLKQVGLANH
jgi:hypothetical protein